MFKKCFLFLILCSFKGFSQDYFAPLFSIQLANATDLVYDVLDDSLNNKIYIAGNFTSIAATSRNYIACFNRTTGAIISTFNANVGATSGNNVKTLHLYNGILYIGGTFSTVSGQSRVNCAAISPLTGALISSFVCNISGNVNCILDFNNNIYLGGNFFQVNSISRNNLAVVSASTGAVQSLNPNIGATGGFGVTKMVLDNSKIYFTTSLATNINGSTRNYLAKIDAATCALDSWNPNPNGQVNDIVVFENELNIIGEFTNIFSANYNYYVRMSLVSGLPVNTTLTNVFTDIPFAPMLYACGMWVGNYLSPVSQFASPNTTITNYPLTFSRFKQKSFLNTYFNNSYYDFITIQLDPNNNNKVINFDYHPCNQKDFGTLRFPWFYYGNTNYGNDIQSIDFMEAISDRFYTTTNRAGTIFFPGPKRLEVLACMPKVPTSFAVGSATVCANTQNVDYRIQKFPYTNQYIWSYTGTGVTINGGDTAVSLNFSPNATSGRLTVKCKGVADRNVLNGAALDLPKDSVYINITVNPLPTVNAGSDITLNCTNLKVNTLNGTTSANTYTWTGPAGYYGTNLSEILSNKPQGNYILEGTYTATGCRWRDTAYVTVDTLKPNLTMPVITNTRLCCSNPSVNLNASSSTAGVTYTWTNNNGYSNNNPALISTTSPTIPVNNMTYSLTVTNPTNGCTNKGSITLLLDTVHPTFGLGVNTSGATISCINTSAVLSGTTGVSRAKLYWNGSGLPVNAPNPATVTNPSTYTLMAKDTINGCQAFVNYTVVADTAKPVINPLPSSKYITCDTTQATLNATSPSSGVTFTWTPPVGPNLPNPSFVTDAGTYTLNATDVNNGCTRSRYITVIVDTLKPNLTTNVDSVMLSCGMLSYTLNTSTTSSPVTIDWAGPGGFTSPNLATVTTQGFYTTTVKNTFNGCIATKQIKVSIDSTKPYIVPFSNNFSVNCSYTTAVLSGTTIPAGQYKLTWNGPSSFTSINPATVSNPGTYTLTALDTITGCESIKIVNLNYQPDLAVNASNDTTICNGSFALLSVSPVGGTPGFTYTWSNGANTSNINTATLTDTTAFIVTVTDNAGCVGKDTVIVFVPDPIQDSSKTYLPCDPNSPFGQIQTFPYGGIPPYQFAIGSGTYQASNTLLNVSFGTHTISIKDNLGCTKTTTATIDNSSLRPEPNFLITTSMFKSDTFVVVDISNPRPDSVQWTFPSTCTIIDNSNPFSPMIVNSDTGTFVINMKAFFGSCEMNKTKLVHIGEVDTTFANSYNNNGIESITLYPNPNSGQFNVEVRLYKKQTFAVFIYDATGVESYRQTINESDYINLPVNMSSATPGSYVLRVVAEYDAKQRTFVISQ